MNTRILPVCQPCPVEVRCASSRINNFHFGTVVAKGVVAGRDVGLFSIHPTTF
jgi:hypothetical protein